jgi:hypothetical protein
MLRGPFIMAVRVAPLAVVEVVLPPPWRMRASRAALSIPPGTM